MATVEGALGGLNGLMPSDVSSANKLIALQSGASSIVDKTDYNVEEVRYNCNDYLNKNFECFGRGYQFSNLPTPSRGVPTDDILMVHFKSVGLPLNNASSGGYRNYQTCEIVYGISGQWYCEQFYRWAIDITTFNWKRLINEFDLTDAVTSGSTAPITSGALYPTAITTPTPVSGVTGDGTTIYGYKSGKMVTIVLNGITLANDILQNQPIFRNVPTAMGNKNVYFTVLGYNTGKSAVMSIIGTDLDAAFTSDDQSKVKAGRYWGTVTYMTSD